MGTFVRPFVHLSVSHPPGPLRPERADFRPERADFRPERADFRPERADFRPERAWGDERTNERTNKRKSPVFYRTSSPSGPLPKNRRRKGERKKSNVKK